MTVDWLIRLGQPERWPAHMLIVLAVSFGGALVLVRLSAAVGAAIGGTLIDRPRPGEVQRRPISRTGGYGIVGAFLLAVLTSLAFANWGPQDRGWGGTLAGLAAGALFLIPFAMWDDYRRLPPLPQLLAQIGCAIVPLLFGIRIDSVSNPFSTQSIVLPFAAGVALTIFWIVGMINALNWLDTSDGLAGGVAMIGALTLFAASLLQRDARGELVPQYTIALLPLALAGACLGFLIYNFPPARIFMGTGGSMFLGYALGVLSIIGSVKIATAVLVLGIPILDTALVILQRLARGRSPLRGGDGAHLIHRLLAAGLSVRQLALLLYGLTALFGTLSVALTKTQKFFGFAAIALAVGLLFLFLKRRGALLPPLSRGPAAPPQPPGSGGS